MGWVLPVESGAEKPLMAALAGTRRSRIGPTTLLAAMTQSVVLPEQVLRITEAQHLRLEAAIDRLNEPLQPLRSFILPGGSPAAAWLHLARTVCRRAERAVVTLMKSEAVNRNVLIYLNRLSDLLFVLGRVANDGGTGDVLWVPGKSRA